MTSCTLSRLFRSGLLALLLVGSGRGIARAQKAAAEARPPWNRLQAAYRYDAQKAIEVTETPVPSSDSFKLDLQLVGPSGQKVPGVFLRPKAEGVYPCVLLLHGLTSNKETMVTVFGQPLLKKGFAILALDAPYHGARRATGRVTAQAPELFYQTVHEGIRDYRRALDYLFARKDIDKKRIGMLGYSMGSIMGSMLGGVDSRIHAFVFCVGGDPILARLATAEPELKERGYTISPSLYVSHIAPRPLLMLNGKQDTTINETATRLLYDAAGQPKQLEWYESGHILPPPAATKGVVWLEEKLKPAAERETKR